MGIHLVVRVDGGLHIGYGHLVRSGAIAQEILAQGGRVTVATTTPDPAHAMFPDSVDVFELVGRGDPSTIVDWLAEEPVDAVYTDAYPVDTEYQRAIRREAPLLVWQDDARHTICAEAFTNGNLYATELEYEYVGSQPDTYLGPKYILLRERIRELAALDPPWRDSPARALVTMGGSDTTDHTPTAVRAFDGLDIRLDVIIGPGFSESQEAAAAEAAEQISAESRLARNPKNLPERMHQADFAVCTSSTTTYELLALGTPVISVPVIDNQVPVARALQERDGAIVLDSGADRSAFAMAVRAYYETPDLRRRRRDWGKRCVDARGTERLVKVLERLVQRD